MKENKQTEIKLIVKESFAGTKPAMQLFSEIIQQKLTENALMSKERENTMERDNC